MSLSRFYINTVNKLHQVCLQKTLKVAERNTAGNYTNNAGSKHLAQHARIQWPWNNQQYARRNALFFSPTPTTWGLPHGEYSGNLVSYSYGPLQYRDAALDDHTATTRDIDDAAAQSRGKSLTHIMITSTRVTMRRLSTRTDWSVFHPWKGEVWHRCWRFDRSYMFQAHDRLGGLNFLTRGHKRYSPGLVPTWPALSSHLNL